MNKNKKKGVLDEAHHHTIYNREEIERAGTVYCISCRVSMHSNSKRLFEFKNY
ncbi:MAG: hypothetical protein K2N48_06970 [Muribaculaceae bacterium]|nr:hypothetical protein [Muribaculaceae bacterium]